MSLWHRAALETRCGLCRGTILVGDPILVYELACTPRRILKVRCQKCAGPAPPDLPAVVERATPAPFAFARFSKDMLPLDYKVAQVGDEDDAA